MKKLYLLIGLLFTVVILAFLVKQTLVVNKAHSTFENYYAFRGCSQLIKRTDTYGVCKTNSGQVIKIVKFKNKWYLDGDLPTCLAGVCF
jgi:hypothetical protein